MSGTEYTNLNDEDVFGGHFYSAEFSFQRSRKWHIKFDRALIGRRYACNTRCDVRGVRCLTKSLKRQLVNDLTWILHHHRELVDIEMGYGQHAPPQRLILRDLIDFLNS